MDNLKTTPDGEWVRFFQGGRMVIGVVHYSYNTIGGYLVLCTDIGEVREDAVLEMRTRSKP